MKRIALVSALLGTVVLAFAGIASAYTVNGDGSLYVGKGEVQSAMKWNNADFDKNAGSVKFAGTGTEVDGNTYTYNCGGNSWSANTKIAWTTSGTVDAKQVLSSNGKQITGWNVSASELAKSGLVSVDSDGLNMINAFNSYNACKQAGGTDGGVTNAPSTTTTLNGLTVNGKTLSVTPTS